MKKILLLTAVLLTAFPAAADPVTSEYVVWLSSVPAATWTNIKTYGKRNVATASGQPYGVTQILYPSNTNYAIIYISSNTTTEANVLRLAVTNGQSKLHAQYEVRTENGIRNMKITAFPGGAYPSDMSVPWVVHKTTP